MDRIPCSNVFSCLVSGECLPVDAVPGSRSYVEGIESRRVVRSAGGVPAFWKRNEVPDRLIVVGGARRLT
jgi:hypothetical protein